MILSANQPYFAPYPGFFSKALESDVFVLLDDVQFPRGTTWVSRNRVKNDQGTLWLTVPVKKKGLGLQRIREVRISHDGRWHIKHQRSLAQAYANSPFYPDHRDFFEEVLSDRFHRLFELNLAIIRYLWKALEIPSELMLQSDMAVTSGGTRLLRDLCRRLGADRFLAQRPAGKYLDEDVFQKAGIALELFTPPVPVYPQLWGPFIANLSTLDLLFNCGPKAGEIISYVASVSMV